MNRYEMLRVLSGTDVTAAGPPSRRLCPVRQPRGRGIRGSVVATRGEVGPDSLLLRHSALKASLITDCTGTERSERSRQLCDSCLSKLRTIRPTQLPVSQITHAAWHRRPCHSYSVRRYSN